MNATAKTLRSATDLIAAGLISQEQRAEAQAVEARYSIAVSPIMAERMAEGSTAIARQFLPDPRELITTADENPDPIADHPHSPVEGLVHRYPDRVLLKITSTCPVYCRFCFRRDMVGNNGSGLLPPAALERALSYIADHPAIFEVILTGGDPFMLSARRAAALTNALAAIPHVKVIRWHTRVPIVAPERITASFVQALRRRDKAVFVAIHANHADEFTPEAATAIARLADAGIGLLSQTVLLKGINDTPEALEALMRAFLAHLIRPYYLHHPDLAPGTSHWRSTIAQGQALMRALRGRLSGLAQPTYVLDVPGGSGKIPLTPSYADPAAGTMTTLAGETVTLAGS